MVIKDVTIKTKSGAPVPPVPVSVPLPLASLWVLGSTRKVQSIDTALYCALHALWNKPVKKYFNHKEYIKYSLMLENK